MGHRRGGWRVWKGMGRMSCGSRSGVTRALSSCINHFSLHLKIKRDIRKCALTFTFLEEPQCARAASLM